MKSSSAPSQSSMPEQISGELRHPSRAKDMNADHRYRLFIVEDNRLVQKNLQYLFGLNDKLDINCFYSGEECVDHLFLLPDIVILDYYLSPPGKKALNGLEVLQRIKEENPETKVIMLSAQDEVAIAVESLKRGATDYVIKDDMMKNNLDKALSNIIRGIELRQEVQLLSEVVKRDKLLIKGYFVIILTLVIILSFYLLS